MKYNYVFVFAFIFIMAISSFAIAADNSQISADSKEKKIDNDLNSYKGDKRSDDFHNLCHNNERTLVSGRIYMADTNSSVPGANVTVECNHKGHIVTLKTISGPNGIYSVLFKAYGPNACDETDNVTVHAQKGSMDGTETGTVKEHGKWKKFDFAIVNVPLVPEFGLALGVMTVLGSVAAFFVIRRK